MNQNLKYALLEAQKAFEQNEVPIGCIITFQDQVIASAHNTREQKNDISAHAEINALKIAASKLNTWKLNECELYVTVEPCLMCYSAIIQSRIKKVYIGCVQQKFKKQTYRHYISDNQLDITNLESSECSKLMSDFFKAKRKD